ncbi:MAG: PfkB family carbohydrate kinase [Patescibacteria group bacterium]|jgi:adenosine kinase
MVLRNTKEIVVTGSMSWDTIMDFPSRFVDYLNPEKLHQINVSFVVDKLEKQIGGTATNIAYAAAQTLAYFHKQEKSDGISINVLGGLGKDAAAHLRFFKKHKIDTSRIMIDRRMYSAAGSVITDTKDNQIWGFYYGASVAAKRVSLTDFVPKETIMIISANHPDAFLHFQEECIKFHIPYMYDPGMALSWITDKDLTEGVLKATYLIGNDYEIAMVLKRIKQTVSSLMNEGVNIITTLGDKGVRYESTTEKYEIPAVSNIEAVDPTGAGDAWRGGFLTALTNGKPVKEALIVGNAVASFAVEHYGCVNYHITAKEFEKRSQCLKV